MKIIEFNPITLPSVSGGSRTLPSLSINFKAGLFSFNKALCEQMGLAGGDEVQFVQDEETGEWFVEKVKKDGYVLRSKDEQTSSLFFNNSTVGRTLKESHEIAEDTKSVRIPIAGVATELGKRKFYSLLAIK